MRRVGAVRTSVDGGGAPAQEKKKVKGAIEKQNMEGAKIYAENAIRKKNESLQMLQCASPLPPRAPPSA